MPGRAEPALIENLSLKSFLVSLMTSLDSSLAVLMAMVLSTFGFLCIRVFLLQRCCGGRTNKDSIIILDLF